MTTRRKFIKSALPFTVGTALLSNQKVLGNSLPGNVGFNKPIVISTWDFGLEANKDAWAILNNKGRALDAVEAGVTVAENDLHSLSVGLAGLPDREGHTTLDACIMDENYNCGSVAFLEKIKNPISVARKVMEKTPHIMLVGEGAQKYA